MGRASPYRQTHHHSYKPCTNPPSYSFPAGLADGNEDFPTSYHERGEGRAWAPCPCLGTGLCPHHPSHGASWGCGATRQPWSPRTQALSNRWDLQRSASSPVTANCRQKLKQIPKAERFQDESIFPDLYFFISPTEKQLQEDRNVLFAVTKVKEEEVAKIGV